MNIGMLWFDNSKTDDLPAKIQRAVQYYQSKYGQKPNLCFVHPSMIAASAAENGNTTNEAVVRVSAGVEVRSSKRVLPNHLWLGMQNN